MSGVVMTGVAGTAAAGTGRGSNKVVLDTAELAELAELFEFTEHRVKAVKQLLADVRTGLLLTERVAPDEAGSAELATALDGCSALLAPLGTALARDHAWVVDVRRRALAADAGPRRRLPREEVERLLAGLAPTTPSSQLVVLEALLLGGLRRTPVRTTGKLVASAGKPVIEGPGRSEKPGATRTPGPPRTPAAPTTGHSAEVRALVRAVRGEGTLRPAMVRAGAEALGRAGQLHRIPQVGDLWLHRGATVQQDRAGLVVAVHPDGSFTTTGGGTTGGTTTGDPTTGGASGDAPPRVRHAPGELASSYGFGRPLPS